MAADRDGMLPTYSFIVPVFNEEAVLPVLLHRLNGLLAALDGPAEVVFVDDGSRDTSGIFLSELARHDARYRYIGFSRNFGHQIAITAGLDHARGDAVIVLDADLQDPPEVVLQLVAKWKEGFEIVHARRISREGESLFKLWTAKLFYRGLGLLTDVQIPADVGDFRLIDRRVLRSFRDMRERDRFVRGMFSWLGYRQATVDFEREARAGGSTKYSLTRMLKLGLDGVVGFSDAPLRLALWVGALVSLGALFYGAYVVVLHVTGVELVSGWASLAVLTSLFAGANLLMTGIVGLYVGRIHAEVKSRPLYVVAREIGAGFEEQAGRDRDGTRERRASAA
jgi:dolichol-phosphate mannosyltransferase